MIIIDGNSINANYYNKGFSWLSIEWLVLSNIAAWATDESCLKKQNDHKKLLPYSQRDFKVLKLKTVPILKLICLAVP